MPTPYFSYVVIYSFIYCGASISGVSAQSFGAGSAELIFWGAKSTPGDAKFTPGDEKFSPGDAEFNPGDEERTSGQVPGSSEGLGRESERRRSERPAPPGGARMQAVSAPPYTHPVSKPAGTRPSRG
eukprot:1176886-Prorocentrum_minimum.AAC.3